VSVEAISWALNLAPVPANHGGQPSSACKFVLVGLANHAGPDGTRPCPRCQPARHSQPCQSCYAVGLHPYQFIRVIAVPRSPSVKSLILRAAINRALGELAALRLPVQAIVAGR
jgi:hypothetical protein